MAIKLACYIAVSFVLIKLVKLQTLESPCPNLFVYEPITEPDRWYGVVTLRSDTELSGVWLRMILDRPALQIGNWFGEVLTTDNIIFRIRKPTHKLPANTSLPLRFFVKYDPSGQIPRVVDFQLNAKMICPEPATSTEPPSSAPELSTSKELPTTARPIFSSISSTELPSPISSFLTTTNTKTLESPCPNLFVYEPITEPDRWYGVVTLRSDTELSGVWLRMIFDRPALQIGNWFGEVLTTDNIIFRIRKPTHKLAANTSLPLRFFVKYDPSGQIPRVVDFQLNAKMICPEPATSTESPTSDPELITSKELPTTARPIFSPISSTELPSPISSFLTTTNTKTLESPCPNLFVYEPITEPDRWYGVVTLRSDTELSGVWLRMILDRPALQIGNWFGEVLTTDNIIFRIRKPTHKLGANTSLPLRFFVKYDPSGQIPRVVDFQLNAKMICPEPATSTEPPSSAPELSTSKELPTTARPIFSSITSTELPSPISSFLTTTNTKTLESPCPNLFVYEPITEPDRWYGVVTLRSDTELSGVWLRMILDRPALQIGNWFGEVLTADNIIFRIRKPTHNLPANTSLPLRFYVKYDPSGQIPRVVDFQLNAKMICPEPATSTEPPTSAPELITSPELPTTARPIFSSMSSTELPSLITSSRTFTSTTTTVRPRSTTTSVPPTTTRSSTTTSNTFGLIENIFNNRDAPIGEAITTTTTVRSAPHFTGFYPPPRITTTTTARSAPHYPHSTGFHARPGLTTTTVRSPPHYPDFTDFYLPPHSRPHFPPGNNDHYWGFPWYTFHNPTFHNHKNCNNRHYF